MKINLNKLLTISVVVLMLFGCKGPEERLPDVSPYSKNIKLIQKPGTGVVTSFYTTLK